MTSGKSPPAPAGPSPSAERSRRALPATVFHRPQSTSCGRSLLLYLLFACVYDQQGGSVSFKMLCPSQKYPTPCAPGVGSCPLATSVERIQDGRQAGPPPTMLPAPLPALASLKTKTQNQEGAKRRPAGARARQAGFAHCPPPRPPLLPLRPPSSPFPWTPLTQAAPVFPGMPGGRCCDVHSAHVLSNRPGVPLTPAPLTPADSGRGPSPPLVAWTLRQHSGRGVSHQPHAGLEGAHLRACSKSCNNPSPLISPPPPRKGGWGPSPARQAPHKYIFMASCVVGQ